MLRNCWQYSLSWYKGHKFLKKKKKVMILLAVNLHFECWYSFVNFMSYHPVVYMFFPYIGFVCYGWFLNTTRINHEWHNVLARLWGTFLVDFILLSYFLVLYTDFPWSKKLHTFKKTLFGVDEFRPLQEQTMNATMSGQDCILVMPTGGGKSLCYQLPAVISKGEWVKGSCYRGFELTESGEAKNFEN